MSRVEVFRGQPRRRWSEEEKRRLVAETLVPGVEPALVTAALRALVRR